MTEYGKLRKALKHLERQLANYQTMHTRNCLTQLDREAIAESVIQRFETCYDNLWKHVKRYLVEEMGNVEVRNSPKPVFRLANENRLLPGTIESWLRYADLRTATAHDYSGEKARECLEEAEAFLKDAIELYRTLTGGPWE